MVNISSVMNVIVGNNAIKSRLSQDIISSSLSHAYIIEGNTGSGRKSLAMLTAAALSCPNVDSRGTHGIPCMNCPSCKKILDRKSPDIIFIDSNGKSSVGVDATRFIRQDVYVIPNDLEHKFYIIDEADKMTVQAQNALLLTLEEPPSFVHFFLICNNASSLLETIRSRAPILRTDILDSAEIAEYLYRTDIRAQQMKLSSEKQFDELIAAAAGSIGKALLLLDEKTWNIAYEQRAFIKKFISLSLSRASASDIISAISSFSSKRDILADQLILLSNAVRDLILVKESDNVHLAFYSDINEVIELCDKVSSAFLFNLQCAITNAINENLRNANVKLLLMKMALSSHLI